MSSVSVVIPTYNRAGFLPACINSVLTSGIPNLEVLVVDDGSTDNTNEVVQAWGSPVQYVPQQNAGPAAARNLGARRSTGTYLCFLDSDDAWLPNGSRRLFRALEDHSECSVVFGDTEMGNPSDGFVSFVDTYGGLRFQELSARPLETDLRLLDRSPFFRQLATRNVMFLGSLLIRREAFEAVGGFHESLCGAADWDLFLRLAARFDVMYCSATPVSRYLKHPVGMSNDAEHMNRDFMLTLAHVLEAADLAPDDRDHVRRLLRRHRFDLGYSAYDSGDLGEARRRFLEAVRLSGPSVRTVAYLALSCAPRGVVDQVRRLRRRVAGLVA